MSEVKTYEEIDKFLKEAYQLKKKERLNSRKYCYVSNKITQEQKRICIFDLQSYLDKGWVNRKLKPVKVKKVDIPIRKNNIKSETKTKKFFKATKENKEQEKLSPQFQTYRNLFGNSFSIGMSGLVALHSYNMSRNKF